MILNTQREEEEEEKEEAFVPAFWVVDAPRAFAAAVRVVGDSSSF